MKKIILALLILVFTQAFTLADEIIDSKGVIKQCKIVTVSEGLIEYQINGCLYSLQRVSDQPIFNDYVDVKEKVVSRKKIQTTRLTGRIIFKDINSVKIRTENKDLEIPWYRTKNIGIYLDN